MYIYIYIYIYIYTNEEYSKEILEIRKENWQTEKRFKSQGTYTYFVCDRFVTKGNSASNKMSRYSTTFYLFLFDKKIFL